MNFKVLLTATLMMLLYVQSALATESEPNNNRAVANTLSPNGSNNGGIGYAADEDWWKITLPGDGKLDVTLTSSNAITLWVYLYDNNGTTQLNAVTTNSSVKMSTDGLAAGTYYARVVAFYNDQVGNYGLVTAFTAPTQANDAEPNNLLSQALNLAPTATVTGHVGYYYQNKRDTIDWYKIVLTKDGKLDLTINAANNNTTWCTLYDNNGNTVLNNAKSTEFPTLSSDGLAAGTYYAKVYMFYSEQFTPYTLTSKFTVATPVNDAEPNNVYTQGLTLTPSDTATGHVGYYYQNKRDTTDWYKIVLNEDGNLKLTINAANNNTTWCTLYDKNGTTVLNNAKSTEYPSVNTDGLAAGTYYIKVYMFYDVQFTPYTLTSKFTAYANANDTEPNDAPYQAKTMAANSTSTGHIGFYQNGGTRNTTDWWKINYTGNGALTLSTTMNSWISDGLNRTYFFEVYKDTSAGYIYHNSFVGSSGNIDLTGLTAGYYFVKIFMFFNDQFGAYNIKNTFTQVVKAKVTLVSADTAATCDSNNSLTIKCTKSNAPYTAQLYRYNLPYGTVKSIKNTQNFVFSNLPKGNYFVQVYGDGATGNAFGKTPAIELMPQPSNAKTTTIQSTQAKLNWNALSCANYFSVQYRKATVPAWTTVKTTGNTTSLIIKNLSAATKYYWRVAAADSANGITGLSAYTDSVTFTTIAAVASLQQSDESAISKTIATDHSNLLVYPNPVNTAFRIQLNVVTNATLFATLRDMNGNALWSKNNVTAPALSGTSVDASKLPAGMYVLQVRNSDGQVNITSKVIVNR